MAATPAYSHVPPDPPVHSNHQGSEQRRAAADQVVLASIGRVLGRTDVNPAHVRTMREPSTGESVDDFVGAVKLVQALEEHTLANPSPATTTTTTTTITTAAYESPCARGMLKADATNRIGELAVTALGTYGSDAIEAWQVWATRSPEAQVAMLRGLLK